MVSNATPLTNDDGQPGEQGTQPPSDLPVDHLHELAHIERLLRLDDRSLDPTVYISGDGVRISWDTYEHNSHARGSLTASVTNEIASTEAWGLSTVHDPQELDSGLVSSILTVLYVPEEAGEASVPIEADHGDGFADHEYVNVDKAQVCLNALTVDIECDNLPAAQLDARDLLDAITSGDVP